MGLSFPALQRAVQDDPVTCGQKVGLLQAANIAGCVAGSLAVGLAGLTWLGTSGSLRVLLAAGVGFALVGVRAYGSRSAFTPLALLLLLLAVALPGRDRLWLRLHGASSSLAMVAEDATSVGAILPWADGWHVAVNGKHHSWLPFGGVHTRLGAVPALMHPAPADVAIVGLGSGDTAWAAMCRSETRSLTAFEIAAPQHALLLRLAGRESLPDLRAFLRDARLRVVAADGRHALARGRERYDLIEADALWPYAAYSGNLYSVEFFRECARRLKPGGLMCTWAPTPRVVATFLTVFPHVAWPRNRSFLVGSNEPIAIEPGVWRERLQAPAVTAYLGRIRADDVLRALERVRLVEEGPDEGVALNRDLYPRDEFLAP
jgi:SAM-dependent methyltransferase